MTAAPAAIALPEARPLVLARPRLGWPMAIGLAVLAVATAVGVVVGPAGLSARGVALELLDRLPFVDVTSGFTDVQQAILWEVRLPRVVLAGIVGAMLSSGGAAYQGVFRNPLADPYLLGVAAGGGLGATLAIVHGSGTQAILPLAALGSSLAVVLTYSLGAATPDRRRSTGAIVLAGVAVASFLTAAQTYVQQQHAETLRQVYTWILGRLTTASWDDVRLVLPYAALSVIGLVMHRRLLDVLRVGEEEAGVLGVRVDRVRITVVALATIGTAAAVAVSGLIGFVGIIVPHTVRLLAGASYRIVVPLSLVGGAAFLIIADVLARSIDAPAELPIGVVTAFFGAPFFLVVLRTRSRA